MMGFDDCFRIILKGNGETVTIRHREISGYTERGHPKYEYDEMEVKAMIHVNPGREEILDGQSILTYDAYALIDPTVTISEGDEIIYDNNTYRVARIIRNRSHVEVILKRVES